VNRRVFLGGALGFLAAPLDAVAQSTGKVWRLGIVRPGLPLDPYVEVFRRALGDLGYREGRNLAIEFRWAHGRAERLPQMAAELAQLRVDAILVAGTAATRAAQRATTTIPIVMAAVGDPVGSRFVASLARPGGNITGVTLFQPEVGGRRLRWLKEVVPAVTGVAVLRNPTDLPSSSPLWRATQAAARTLRLQLHSVDARDSTDLTGAFAEMARAHDDALCVLPDTLFTTERGRVVALAAQNHLPAVYPGREFVEAGGLMSDAASLRDQFHRAAAFVDKILKGAKPSDLPVEPPTKFEFVVNLKVAKALRLTIPPPVLARADEVIQ